VARAEAYLRAKFHLDSSNRLATVHERYRQDRQDRQDRTDMTDRQRTDSIGRTVLQTVAQKYQWTHVRGPMSGCRHSRPHLASDGKRPQVFSPLLNKPAEHAVNKKRSYGSIALSNLKCWRILSY